MNSLDVIFLMLAGLSVFGGYRLGFVARAFSWVGLIVGIVIAVVVIPLLFHNRDTTSQGQLLYALAILIGLAFVGQTIGTVAGSRVRERMPQGAVRSSDRFFGALAGLVGLMFFAWLILPAIAEQPGSIAELVRQSEVVKELHSILPSPPNALDALKQFVGSDQFPEVFDAFHRVGDVPQPPQSLALSASTVNLVRQSTVRVVSYACNSRLQEGSGFFIRSNLIVTNAHVIAGQESTTVYLEDGERLHATPVVFDPDRDVAILRIDRSAEPPLAIEYPTSNEQVAVFGHPGGQIDLRIAPAQVAQRINAIGKDIYGNHRTNRDILILASELRQGDSGSAVVNARGDVVGIAFAIDPDHTGVAYALAPTELTPLLNGPLNTEVSTGQCVAD